MIRATMIALSILVVVMLSGSASAQAAGFGWVSPMAAAMHSAPDDEDFDDTSDFDEVDEPDSSANADDGLDEGTGDEGQEDESTGEDSVAEAESNAPEAPDQQELPPLAVPGEALAPTTESLSPEGIL